MEIFISWSGPRSNKFARFVKDWLKDLLHPVTPWMSEHDIAAGSRWNSKLIEALERSSFGILCVTAENQHAPWMVFEAGALSRQMKQASVVPVLLGLTNAELKAPLSQFQAVDANRDGMYHLVLSINAAMPSPLELDRLKRCFDRCWPELESAIAESMAIALRVPDAPIRPDREILDEMLEMLRAISQAQIPVFAAGAGTDAGVYVDLKPMCGEHGQIVRISIDLTTSVSDFLDQVYFAINRFGHVVPYTYTTRWLLRDEKTGRVYDKMGKKYGESRGEQRDERPLSTMGIAPDSRLIAFPISK
ncbi:MAG: TIR domain-containing protein [Planctomycetota bacterium]